MIGELQLVFTIKDEDTGEKLGFAYILKYTRAMMKFLQ